MNRTHRAALAACALVLGACATAKFSTTWVNPEAQALSFKAGDKTLAMVPVGNEGMRRIAEDALARAISSRGLQGVASYTLVPAELTREKAHAAAKQIDAAGAVVMRVLAKGKANISQLSESSSYTATWTGDSGWSTPYNPSDMRSDTVLVVETLVYDMRQDKLVWAGRSETTNPSKIDGLIQGLADQTARQLRQQGLVK